ncbi:MAG: hypothetical protein AB4290_09795, partial [Spirulina sp.]
METRFYEFDCLEFADCTGKYRTIRQCSLTDRDALRDTYNHLLRHFLECFPQHLDEVDDNELFERVEALWDRPDDRFRYLCNKCLHLAGVKSEWVNLSMLVELLFRQCKTFLLSVETETEKDEGIKPGLLIQLNFPQSNVKKGEGEGATYEEILASLWAWTNDIEKALEVARNHPAGELIKILEARAKLERNSTP